MANIGYSPDTAIAVAIGANSGGFVAASAPTWDDGLMTWNLRAIETRQGYVNDMLAREAARAAAGQARVLEAVAGAVSRPKMILGLGDSITSGNFSFDGLGWRGTLSDMLRAEHIDLGGPVVKGAQSGLTLGDAAPNIPAMMAQYNPDVVTLFFGANDAVRPEMTNWQSRYQDAIQGILNFSPDVSVTCCKLMVSCPPAITGGTTNMITLNGYIDAAVAAFASTGRVNVCDLSVLPAQQLARLEDGTHPTDYGYTLMATLIYKAVWGWLQT